MWLSAEFPSCTETDQEVSLLVSLEWCYSRRDQGKSAFLHRSRDASEDAAQRAVEGVECHQQDGDCSSADHAVLQGGDPLFVGLHLIQKSEAVCKHIRSFRYQYAGRSRATSLTLELGRA